MFSLDMYRNMGAQGPLGMYSWFGLSAYISLLILPPYGRLFAEEQVLEGRFRTVSCISLSRWKSFCAL
jgi:hypothetical protein